MAFKPKGYNIVSPYLIVNGSQPTINFLVTEFNASPLWKHPREAGKLGHGEIRIDDSVLMLCDAVDGGPAAGFTSVQEDDALYLPRVSLQIKDLGTPFPTHFTPSVQAKGEPYSTVTLLAKFRGLSTSVPRAKAA